MKTVPHINEGRGQIREVFDRPLPTKLDPECTRSAEEGGRGKGLTKQSMNESLADFGHAPEITED